MCKIAEIARNEIAFQVNEYKVSKAIKSHYFSP